MFVGELYDRAYEKVSGMVSAVHSFTSSPFKNHETMRKVEVMVERLFKAGAYWGALQGLPFGLPTNIALIGGTCFVRAMIRPEKRDAKKYLREVVDVTALGVAMQGVTDIISKTAFRSVGDFARSAACITPLLTWVWFSRP